MTTISLELAKELKQVCKEKAIKLPKSRFNWQHDWLNVGKCIITDGEIIWDDYRHIAPAYTLDELIEIMPKEIKRPHVREGERTYYRTISRDYMASYMSGDGTTFFHETDANPANAACKLLIWLIKEGMNKNDE